MPSRPIPSGRAAYLRHARHFLIRLRGVVAASKSGATEALESFEVDLLPQVLDLYEWLCDADTEECLSLRCAYVISGATLFHTRLAPADFLRMLERALDAARGLDDPRRVRIIHSNMGVASRSLQDLDAAAFHFGQSLDSARQSADRRAIGFALGNLANVELDRERPEAAIELLREAVALFRDLGDRPAEALALSNLGVALTRTDRLDEAEPALIHALEHARALGRQGIESNALTNLGNLHKRQGNDQVAATFYRASLVLDRSLGDSRGEATNLYNLTDLLVASGDLERAAECARLALELRARDRYPGSDQAAQKLADILAALEGRGRDSPQE